MEYNTVCGLEVHTELSTKTKIFCNCSTAFGGEPNSHVCEICAAVIARRRCFFYYSSLTIRMWGQNSSR